MTGREIIDGMVRGDIPLPSVAGLLGMRAGDYGDGRASVVMPAAPEQGNAAATMHGGIVATLLDSAMFFAYVTTLGEGQFATTLQMNVQYLRPVPLDGGEVAAEGRVVRAGRRVGTVEGVLRDARGRDCAVATSTCMVA